MSLTISAVTMNSAEPQVTAAFWAEALGGTAADGGNGFVHVRAPGLLLIVQPDPGRVSVAPTDVHLDLSASDVGAEFEIARLCELGASVIDHRSDSHGRWTVMTDPDGRQFCVSCADT